MLNRKLCFHCRFANTEYNIQLLSLVQRELRTTVHKTWISLWCQHVKTFVRQIFNTYSPCWDNWLLNLLTFMHIIFYQLTNKTISRWWLTLHIGRGGSRRLTNRLSLFKSKCTIFFPWRYSIPNATSMAITRRFRLSRFLKTVRDAFSHPIFYV